MELKYSLRNFHKYFVCGGLHPKLAYTGKHVPKEESLKILVLEDTSHQNKLSIGFDLKCLLFLSKFKKTKHLNSKFTFHD